MARTLTIVIFDSGLGGLTVFREVVKARPDCRYIYVADDAFFPYNARDQAELVPRVVSLMGQVIHDYGPDYIVIACNTASTLVLPQLRSQYPVPFIGTVPAIKPACALTQSRLVTVLGTEATVSREYTRALIREFADGVDVKLVGSARLASYAEHQLNGDPVPDPLIAAELAPCFTEAGESRTDTIVLACTHYPLLLHRLEQLAPWAVTFIDPAPAIARRVRDLSGPEDGEAAGIPARIVFTSGRPISPALQAALEGFGIFC